MDRYTVLLVDDEEEVTQVIMRKINWEDLGFSVIGIADNGIKALELMEKFQPDVVMTDIRMPYMDGMELSTRIKAEYPATKILFFTGFDEFEYAREAVHLKAEEFLLKPVNAVELTNVFTALKIRMDREISEKRNAEILQKYYMESLPFLKASFYTSLIEGKIRREELSKYLTDYQVSFTGPCYCCLVIHTSATQTPEGINPLLLSASVQKQAVEHLEKWEAKCFSYLENTILIAQLADETMVLKLTDDCDRFCRYARRMIGAIVTIGIGQVCRDIMELPQSYSGAKEAVSYRVIYGASKAINIKEIAPQESKEPETANDAQLFHLFKMIRMGREEDVKETVGQYLNQSPLSAKSLQQHDIAIMELVTALYNFSINNDIAMEEFFAESRSNEAGSRENAFEGNGFKGFVSEKGNSNMRKLYGSLLEMEPEVLKKWLIDISLFFREKLISARSMSTKSFVFRAKEYVRNNYGEEDLSLDRICEVLGVSNAYFSTVFKKETGNSFIGYLTDYRMDKASRLLIETNKKSYMIAKEVGYGDPNYFSYVFKRRFGVSPKKYRTEHGEREG